MKQTAYNKYHFAFGFRAKMGFEDYEKLREEPDVIELYESDATSVANVKYHMYFEEFSIVQIQELYGTLIFSSINQAKDTFWSFDFNVKLLLDAEQNPSFNDLPEDIQQQLLDQFQNKVKNLNPNTMFSIFRSVFSFGYDAMQISVAIMGNSYMKS